MTKVLVTGATGFIGRTAVKKLLGHGYDVGVAARNIAKAVGLFGSGSVSILDTCSDRFAAQIHEFMPDAVIHLAAYFNPDPDISGVEQLIDTNILFTVKLLEALRGTPCKLFVNAGTFSEQLNDGTDTAPQNLYSATKSALRPIMRYYSSTGHWKWVNLIIYTPYGRTNQSKKVIDYMVDALGAPQPVAFSAGDQVLDFIHVDDIAEMLCRILQHRGDMACNEELHAGTGHGHSLRRVAAAMEQVFGCKMNADWGARPYRPREIMHAVAPIEHTRDLLHWQPQIMLNDGLKIFREDLDNTRTTPKSEQ